MSEELKNQIGEDNYKQIAASILDNGAAIKPPVIHVYMLLHAKSPFMLESEFLAQHGPELEKLGISLDTFSPLEGVRFVASQHQDKLRELGIL